MCRPYKGFDGLEQLQQVLRELALVFGQKARHPSYFGDGVACALELARSRAYVCGQLVGAGTQVRSNPSAYLVGLAFVVLKQTRESAAVALGVSSTILAVEIPPPARARGTHELFIASRICTRALENVEVGAFALIREVGQVA
jgi:hypothetical protein